MSFFKHHVCFTMKKCVLQHRKIEQKALERSPIILHFTRMGKRTSAQALPGSMTVEAALVLPLFLFAMVNLLSLVLMFQTFSKEEIRLHQTGRQLALFAYGQEEGEQEIRLSRSSLVRPVIPVAGFPETRLVNGCVMHKWIGYDLQQEGQAEAAGKEELVYITKSGTAYHRSRSCTYLNPSIQMLPLTQAKEAVNQEGRPYTACESCKGDSQMVYVTREGIRYHSSVGCSGLKRTVTSVSLQEALEAGRHACPGCG